MATAPDGPSALSAGLVLQWDVADGVLRFTVRGDLDLAVHTEVANALHARPPGPAPLVEIDLAAVTFLDVSTARLFSRHREAVARQGGEVRIVNANQLQRQILQMVDCDAVAEPAVRGGIADSVWGTRSRRMPCPWPPGAETALLPEEKRTHRMSEIVGEHDQAEHDHRPRQDQPAARVRSLRCD